MYVLYQQGIGISNVYFLHVATILWLFISTNSIVRIRSGLDRKVAKNKTEPHSGVQHSKKLSRSLSSEAERASKKRSLRKGSKKCMSKRGLWILTAVPTVMAEAASSLFMAFLSMAVWAVGRHGRPTGLLSDLHAELECVFMCGLQNSPPQQQSIHFLNFEFNWNCVS